MKHCLKTPAKVNATKKKPAAAGYVFQPPKRGVRRMMQRPANHKKPSGMYTRSRGVEWNFNRRRNLHRDVKGNFFVYGKNEEVVKHLYEF
eukprot:3998783-Amphidinium_carterae.1